MTKRLTNPLAEEILNLYFPVLDHGFVSLVDYMGSDEDVERAARLSFGPTPRKVTETRGLMRYLRRHKHTTPSEMVELKFHCCMPIFIARQWIRHRTASVNEVSGRYSMLPMLFYMPEQAQLGAQSKANKQGREDGGMGAEFYESAVWKWRSGRQDTQKNYEWMASNDVAKEIARIDLPLSTYTQWYWKIDMHNLMHFLGLRVDSHAQWEIQQYGKIMAGMLKRVAPLSYEAWIDYDVCGVRFSRAEMEVIRQLVGFKAVEVDRNIRPFLFARKEVVNEPELTQLGISGRELIELENKLKTVDTPDFELDLSKAKPASFFEAAMAEAAPQSESKS